MADPLDTRVPAEDHPKSAPGELNHIRRFVNTLDKEDGSDEIAEPEALRDWLAERGFIDPAAEIGAAELRQAHDLREAIRKLLLANNGDPPDPAAAEVLNAAARRAELQVAFDSGGEAELEPVRTGFDGAIGKLLAIVYCSMAAETWPRLKACALHDDCEWAFFDWSKNRSGTWCDMKVCGNRAKARAYRERKRGQG